jgi:Transglycosylase SLT domain
MADFDPDAYLASKTKVNPFDAALAAEGVDGKVADIARSIYQQESGSGKNTKTSNAGAVGGMQIIPATFNRMADKGWAIDNPDHNARAGIRYIKTLYDKAGGDPALTAAGYYGGEGAIAKAKAGIAVSDPRNPNAPTTLQYGQQVAARLSSPASIPATPIAGIPAPGIPAPAFDPDAYLNAIPQKPVAAPQTSLLDTIKQGAGNAAAGLVRGAGSIGQTILTAGELLPSRMIPRVAAGGNILPDMHADAQQRAKMDAGLQELGANPDSWMYKGGKLGGEILGTAGTGNVLALGAKGLGATPQVINALRSGGMAGGGNLATRIGAGAATGAASTALISPDIQDVGLGAALGGGLPVAAKGAAFVGNALGRMAGKGAQTPEMVNAITSARDAGYVIPPTQANPTMTNRLLEGFSGKLTTAQNASAKNSEITNGLAAKALGLPAETAITPDLLSNIRKTASASSESIAQTGTITPTKSYSDALDKLAETHLTAAKGFPNAKESPVVALVDSLRSPSFEASSALAKIRELRSAADDAFRTGNTDIARASKGAAKALEDAVETHLQDIGNPALLNQFRDARTLMAKTYTVEKALNATTGTVDARKLGAMVNKGKPLTDELRQAGEFANRFPKANQTVEGMGSLPQTSPLDWGAAGAISAASGNVLPMLSAGARPIARKMALSDMVQNRLVQQSPRANRLADLLRYSNRAIPAIASQ